MQFTRTHARSHSRGYDQWAGPRSCERRVFRILARIRIREKSAALQRSTAVIASFRSSITDDRWSAQSRAAAAALDDINTKLARPPLRSAVRWCAAMPASVIYCVQKSKPIVVQTVKMDCITSWYNFCASNAVIRLRSMLSRRWGRRDSGECVRVCVQCDASINLPANYCAPIWIDSQSHPDISVHTHTHALFCVHPSDAEFRANAFALESTVRCTPNQKSPSSRVNLSNAKIDRFSPF